jgi:hypothetical protein
MLNQHEHLCECTSDAVTVLRAQRFVPCFLTKAPEALTHKLGQIGTIEDLSESFKRWIQQAPQGRSIEADAIATASVCVASPHTQKVSVLAETQVDPNVD